MRARIASLACSLLFTCMGATAVADEPAFAGVAPVANAVLDGVRGGFEVPENLRASMSLERVAYVNGELVATRSASIPDIGNMTSDQAAALANATGTLVIQNGPNNAFNVADLGASSTVIQNTLSDQHLVALTTISVEVNSLSAFREMNFQDGLRDTLIATPGVR